MHRSVDRMRKYAEIQAKFVVGFHERDDMRRPEFSGRIAIRVDMLTTQPEIGWYFDGSRFFSPDPSTQPHNVNLDPPPPTDRALLEETRKLVEQILALVTPGPP